MHDSSCLFRHSTGYVLALAFRIFFTFASFDLLSLSDLFY